MTSPPAGVRAGLTRPRPVLVSRVGARSCGTCLWAGPLRGYGPACLRRIYRPAGSGRMTHRPRDRPPFALLLLVLALLRGVAASQVVRGGLGLPNQGQNSNPHVP